MGNKKGIVYVLVILVIGGLMVAELLTALSYSSTKEQMQEDIALLQQMVDEYESGQITVYQVINDVKAGNRVMEYDIATVGLKPDVVPENVVTDISELEGKLYKTGLSANTYLTADMLIEETLTDDMREMDIVMNEVPIGLEEGDYIDVRITFPLGQDFVAMTHKKVSAINGNTVKLVINEKDFYSYESMKADYGRYRAVRIYGAKYVEAGVQGAAVTYYPVSAKVLKTMMLDPNMDTADYDDILAARKQLEEQNVSELIDKQATVTANKEYLDALFMEASQEYARLQEEKERQAAENGNAGNTDTGNRVQLN